MNKEYVVFGDTEYELNDALVGAVYDFIIDELEQHDGDDDNIDTMFQKSVSDIQEIYAKNEKDSSVKITLDMLKSIVYSNVYACLNILLTRYSYRLKRFGKTERFSTIVRSYYGDVELLSTLFVNDLFHISGIIYAKNAGDRLAIAITNNKHTEVFNVYEDNSQIADYLSSKNIKGYYK